VDDLADPTSFVVKRHAKARSFDQSTGCVGNVKNEREELATAIRSEIEQASPQASSTRCEAPRSTIYRAGRGTLCPG
jgi:hypothetical protein